MKVGPLPKYTPKDAPRIFLSHNSADKEFVRHLAATLTLAGAQVWFDSWQIRPGDSIPSAIDEGLSGFDTFVLVWSNGAANSNWVAKERDAAITRWTNEKTYRFIPVRLDSTPIPTLLGSVMYVDANDHDHVRVTRELLGISSKLDFLRAIQDFIGNSGIEFRDFYGVGVFICCPRCGTESKDFESFQHIDENRDDTYAVIQCPNCKWFDSAEI